LKLGEASDEPEATGSGGPHFNLRAKLRSAPTRAICAGGRPGRRVGRFRTPDLGSRWFRAGDLVSSSARKSAAGAGATLNNRAAPAA
jgi:hypothetical protein